MIYKVFDLENETFLLYTGKSFCAVIGITERTFTNRWRLKTTLGIVVRNRWYIKEVAICE